MKIFKYINNIQIYNECIHMKEMLRRKLSSSAKVPNNPCMQYLAKAMILPQLR